jgi:hypothetical protein
MVSMSSEPSSEGRKACIVEAGAHPCNHDEHKETQPMNRSAANPTDPISNPFRILSAGSKSIAILSLGLAVLSAASAQTAPARRQLPPPDGRPAAVNRVELPPAVIPPLKAVRRPRDTQANARLDRRSNTVTLPDGSKAPLSRLRRQFAAQEAQLNRQGFSMFDPDSPGLELTPDLDYDRLEAQRAQLLHHRLNERTPDTGGLLAPFDGAFGHSYPWSWSAGNHDYFQISLDSDITVIGFKDYLYASAEGSADGAILGQDFNIASAQATASAYQGSVYGAVSLQVLGNYIMDWSTTQSTSYGWNWSWQQEIAAPFDFTLGFIPIHGRVGVRGGLGCAIDMGLYGGWAYGRVTPSTSLSGFAEVGVGTWWASAGVGGELTFLRLGFPVEAGSYFQWNNGPQLVNYIKSSLDVSTLDGRLYIYAQAFGYEEDWTLWNWDGIHWSGDLFNASFTTNL